MKPHSQNMRSLDTMRSFVYHFACFDKHNQNQDRAEHDLMREHQDASHLMREHQEMASFSPQSF